MACDATRIPMRRAIPSSASNLSRVSSWLESEDQLSSEASWRPVKEVAESGTVQIILHVSRIRVVEQVVDAKPHFHLAFLARERYSEFLEYLQVEGPEAGESFVVPRADEVPFLVNDGVRKSGVNIKDWHQGYFPRRAKFSPG